MRADALGAKQHFASPHFVRIGRIRQQVVRDGLGQQVNKQRRNRDAPRAVARKQAQVIRFERAGGQQAITKVQEKLVAFTRISVLQRLQASRRDGQAGRLHQRCMQGELGRARLGHRCQFGPGQKKSQIVIGRQQPAALVAL